MIRSVAAVLLTSILVSAATLGPAVAQAGPAGKITICHATSSPKNPYVRITVNVNGLNGHGKHAGDIIPAPANGCPKDTASCDGHGLPCEQIPFLPGTLAGLLALGGGAAGAYVVRRRGRHGRNDR